MKKIVTLLFSFWLSIILVFAQDPPPPPEVPQAFNYTGIAMDDKGKEISNKMITVRATILDKWK